MNIRSSTKKFEKWKSCRIALVKKDIGIKHQEMAASPFPFFRATFYRWLQLWEKECGKEAAAPKVLAVGDLHVENFGTWRDQEGRLIWGVNDFDEAYPMPYTIDLVRLATSAYLAATEEHLELKLRAASKAILQGYLDGIKSRGLPFVLEEDHKWLRQIALNRLRDPVRFWSRLEHLPQFTGPLPEIVKRKLEAELPEPGLPYLKKRRIAGLGSLGHFRVVVLAQWRGGWIAREAKALCHSSCLWQNGQTGGQILYQEIISRAVRVPDPFLRIHEGMLYRRLAPDCSRILLSSLPKDHDEVRLLRAMGFETANIHLGSRSAVAAIQRDLERRPKDWLHRAARRMAKAVVRDWEEWARTH